MSAFKALTLGLIRTQLQPRARQGCTAEPPGAGCGQQSPQQLGLLQHRCHRAVSSPPQTSAPPRCDIWNGVSALSHCCHPPGPIQLCSQRRAGRNHRLQAPEMPSCCFQAGPGLFTAYLECFMKYFPADPFLDTYKCQKHSAKSFLYKYSISLAKFLRSAAIQTSASLHLQASVIPKMVLPSRSVVQFQHSFILLLVPVVL